MAKHKGKKGKKDKDEKKKEKDKELTAEKTQLDTSDEPGEPEPKMKRKEFEQALEPLASGAWFRRTVKFELSRAHDPHLPQQVQDRFKFLSFKW